MEGKLLICCGQDSCLQDILTFISKQMVYGVLFHLGLSICVHGVRSIFVHKHTVSTAYEYRYVHVHAYTCNYVLLLLGKAG